MTSPSAAPLVGRAAQLKRMDDALSQLSRSGLAVLIVTGVRGIGKTRLMDELARRAFAAGLYVFRAQAMELTQHVPLSVLTDAMHPQVDGRDPNNPDDAWAASSGEDERRPAATGQPAERLRIHRLVRRTLEGVRGTGAALVLDDVHWADPASLEQVEYLVRRPPRVPTLLALAFR